MTLSIGQILLGIQQESQNIPGREHILPNTLQLFKFGNRDEAMSSLINWLQENAETHVKIHDPYFTASELEILKFIPPDIHVLILTSWQAQRGISPGDIQAVQKRFKDAWARISDQQPPNTRVYILGDSEIGDCPMHDRYYTTANGRGITLGTSQSGLGMKDSHIRILDPSEVPIIEAEHFDRLVFFTPTHFRNRQLILESFLLTL